jgi:hypothetical protein
MRITLATAVCAACLASMPPAQGEKITLGITPKPGQTIHYTATQEISVQITPDAAPGTTEPAAPPMKMAGKTLLGYTLVAGAASPQGQVTSQMTFEKATSELSINGTPFPAGDAMGQMVGQTLTVVFGMDGNVVDVTAPGTSKESAELVKRLFTEMYRYFPTMSLSVGEATTRPLSVALPLPIPGIGPVTIDGHLTTKLVSLEAEGAERLASCEQSYDASFTRPSDAAGAAATPAPAFDMTMRGNATAQINVDRGVVKASQLESTFDGAFASPLGGADAPKLKLHGVMTATVAGKY